MSYGRIISATLHGLDVKFVQVEADLSNGLPSFHMVGYLSAEVKEAGERVRTAIQNSGINLPAKKTIINLSPANIRKRGTSFDLSIALAILSSLGVIKQDKLENAVVIGELGLDGRVHRVNGVLPIVAAAKEKDYSVCILPKENEREAILVKGIQIVAVSTLQELFVYLNSDERKWNCEFAEPAFDKMIKANHDMKLDFQDICGQEMAKRAAEIAVAGRHNLLLLGPPGSGKSMIAKRIPTILPELTLEESIEITKTYSVRGLLDEENPLITVRPFREVHHTITKAALIGGGNIPCLGELSLASKGIIFLDELAEFSKSVLEVLRQPLEEREINIVRNQGNYLFPADVMLVAAMNPCPCGYYPDYNKCSCTEYQIRQYLGKISQPFLGRMDLCIEVPKLSYEALRTKGAESSSDIRKRIVKAQGIQKERYKDRKFKFNAGLSVNDLDVYCQLDREGERLMKQAFEQMELTARTCHRIIKVARTIADLSGEARISALHLQEALGYRMVDKKYWGKN